MGPALVQHRWQAPCWRSRSLICANGHASVASRGTQCRAAAAAHPSKRVLWLQTTSQEAMTSAVECGYRTLLFEEEQWALAQQWRPIATFKALCVDAGGHVHDEDGNLIGQVLRVSSKAELQAAERAAMPQPGTDHTSQRYVIMDAVDWKVIPAENLVAAFQAPGAAKLLGTATSAADARVMLEALEVGTAGVVLRTDDAAEVRQLAAYMRERDQEDGEQLQYETATVSRIEPVGMGDRVCVDLCAMLKPGEGMLVGSFARALFLVHSECMESQYINSRPFRVNAGPVHAYIQAPQGRTAYLSELRSGSEVVVADAAGRMRTAIVGRIKIESRPLMLVEACTADGVHHSTLLQNAETVRLIGPQSSSGSNDVPKVAAQPAQAARRWCAVSVSELSVGDEVYLLRQQGARHTGISIQESVVER